jgi:hypothetical protein
MFGPVPGSMLPEAVADPLRNWEQFLPEVLS